MYHKHIQAVYMSILIILAIILQRKQTEETEGYGHTAPQSLCL